MPRASADRVLGVVFNRRGRQDVQLVKREVERGALGEIYHARAFWMRRSGIPGLGTWFTSKEMAGGGPLIDLGVHVLDMALWVLGNPRARRVSAATYAELGPQGTWSVARRALQSRARRTVRGRGLRHGVHPLRRRV